MRSRTRILRYSLASFVLTLLLTSESKAQFPAARAEGGGQVNLSGAGNTGIQPNSYINEESFDIGSDLELASGPVFVTPTAGLFLVNYRQQFRNPHNEIPTPPHYQYTISLRIDDANVETYSATISTIDRSDDYAQVSITDLLYLGAGTTVEAMESIDFGSEGGTLQKYSAIFSMTLMDGIFANGFESGNSSAWHSP
ncbi:MAG: hypothetical protein GY719_22165 [bacterium]|nr:hypothetical protein [bacterium]